MVERNMCNAVMRGTVIPPGSKSTSRANGLRRNLGYPTSGRRLRVCSRVRRSASGRRGAVADLRSVHSDCMGQCWQNVLERLTAVLGLRI